MDFCAQKIKLLEGGMLKTVHCRRCQSSLGQTSPRQLVVNGVVVRHKVVLECRECGERRTWLPLEGDYNDDSCPGADGT